MIFNSHCVVYNLKCPFHKQIAKQDCAKTVQVCLHLGIQVTLSRRDILLQRARCFYKGEMLEEKGHWTHHNTNVLRVQCNRICFKLIK